MTRRDASSPSRIICVILAGGASRRMGGEDKGLLPVDDKRLIEYVIERLQPQCETILINCNRNREAYARYGFPLVEDTVAGAGPLAGLLSALESPAAADARYILSVPCDTPLLPTDLVARMIAALEECDADACTVNDGERLHPVIMLVKRSIAGPLRHYLEKGGRKVHDWFYSQSHCLADFANEPQAFVNINTPHQLQTLQKTLYQEEE